MKNFAIVIILVAAAVVFATVKGIPHYYHLLSMICAFMGGFFAHKYQIRKVK